MGQHGVDDAHEVMRRPRSNSTRSHGPARRGTLGWSSLCMLIMLALAGCGGSDGGDAVAPVEPLATLSEDKLPEGARIDLSSQPIHVGDEWVYDRVVNGAASGAVTLAVTSGPDKDGAVTMAETDATDASLNRSLAYRQTDDGLVWIDPFGARTRYPGLYQALPEALEYPARAYPIGTVRRHLRQGSLRADIDGDGLDDYYRAEFTQVFQGYQQLAVFGQATQVAQFTNTLTLTLKTTRDNRSATRASTEDRYFAAGIGLVRADRVTNDGAGTPIVPAYRLELSGAKVGKTVLPTGQMWKARDSGTRRTLLGVASSGSNLVAVGALGTIVSSPDAKVWTTRASGIAVHLNAVATNGTIFVAVGDLGTVVSSTDLATWTARPSGTARHLRGIAWTGSQFIAVGEGGTILGSTDGATWAARNSGSAADLYAVAGHSLQIVAVGASGTILNSPNGESWTQQPDWCCEALYGVVWSGTQFLTVGRGWSTSDDGVNWSVRGFCCIGFRGATWSGAHFVAVGENGDTISTADGIAYSYATAHSDIAAPSALFGVVWHGGEFIAVGSDGAVFAAVPRKADVSTLYGVAASPNAVVAVGVQGTIISSTDGSIWTPRVSGVTVALRSIAYSGATFVIVGDKGTILTSSDLANWVVRTSGAPGNLRSVAWVGSRFVAVGDGGTILLSPDGVTWTPQSSPTATALLGVAGNPSQTVVVSAAGTVLTSPDGTAWTESAAPGWGLSGVIWSGSQFLGYGSYAIFTSYDGLLWTSRRAATGNAMYGAAAAEAGFVLVGQYGAAQTSSDGIAWRVADFTGGRDLAAVAWFGGRFIVVGQGVISTLP